MKDDRTIPADTANTIPRMPSWVTVGRAETPEDVAFLSGAALGLLHVVLGRDDVPAALLRDRLALHAAESCVGFAGRPERAADLRDALHLLRPGDRPGPAGAVYHQWRRAVDRAISAPALKRAMPELLAPHVPVWLEAGQGGVVRRAAAVLEAVLTDHPAEEAAALILADAALARALGWGHLVPVLAAGLNRRDLRSTGDDLTIACHRAVVKAAPGIAQLAADLTRRAGALHAVSVKLRAKGASDAVAIFLTRDAVAPAALTGFMSDRAARRLCDRLVSLGVVRELTGRDTFRLYGV